MEIRLQEITDSSATIAWEPEDGAECYRVYWADSDTPVSYTHLDVYKRQELPPEGLPI